jgi:hypothetical protein
MTSVLPDSMKRITKLRLVKDLKYGKVHLRQSHIELGEFDDMNKIFKKTK